jgi:hypothetical protein
MPAVRHSWFLGFSLTLAAVAAAWGVVRIIQHERSAVIRQPSVLVAKGRPETTVPAADCPIPVPTEARNLQYAVWSYGQVTQSWIRFEAPPDVCLAHAERLIQPFEEREGWAVSRAAMSNDPGVICVLDPTEVDLSWFDLDRSGEGRVYRVNGGRAPVIWVDTGRGHFYCEVKNACHSLSPP